MSHGITCHACLYIVTKIKPFLSQYSKVLQAQWEAASPLSVLLHLTRLLEHAREASRGIELAAKVGLEKSQE